MKSALFCLFENWKDNYSNSITEQVKLIKYVEELDFDEAWITEHHFNNFSVMPSPLSIVNYILGATTKIKIGTAGILLPYYNPIKLAEELAVTSSLADDRFIYGVAKGAFPIYDKTFGSDPLVNREIMFEYNTLICKLLVDDSVNFDGKYFQCSDVSIRPKLDKKPKTYFSSQSNEAIKSAAINQDGIVGSLAIGNDEIRELFDTYNSYNPKHKLSFKLARAINICDDKQKAWEEAQKACDIFLKSMMGSKDTNPALVKLLTKEYKDIRDKLFDKNKILKNAIIGTPKECIEQIKELNKEFDIETLLLKPAVTSYDRAYDVLKIYKEEVEPFI